MRNLLQRIIRRLDGEPRIRYPWSRFKDWGEDFQFWGQSTQRIEMRRRLGECRSVKDHHAFFTAVFPSHQIESEIIAAIRRLAQEQPKTVCEIGTAQGGTNFLLTNAIDSVQAMIGIDLFVRSKTRLRYYLKAGRRVDFIDGSSIAPSTLHRVRKLLGGQELDVLFIDGDHTYEGVKQDFLLYRELVRDGGIILFHDIVPDYKTRYGRETGNWAGDVPVFWSRIKNAFQHEEFVADAGQDGFGIGLLVHHRGVRLPDGL